jgi:hypothetical protein
MKLPSADLVVPSRPDTFEFARGTKVAHVDAKDPMKIICVRANLNPKWGGKCTGLLQRNKCNFCVSVWRCMINLNSGSPSSL